MPPSPLPTSLKHLITLEVNATKKHLIKGNFYQIKRNYNFVDTWNNRRVTISLPATPYSPLKKVESYICEWNYSYPEFGKLSLFYLVTLYHEILCQQVYNYQIKKPCVFNY